MKWLSAAIACGALLPSEAKASDRLECPQASSDGAIEEVARFRELTAGRRSGERIMCRGADGAITFVYRFGRFSWTRTETVKLDENGLPRFVRVEGEMSDGTNWAEQFEREGRSVRWMTPRERGETSTDNPVYYYPVYPAQDLGVLARSLLARPDRGLKLVPGGEARIAPMSSLEVSRGDETQSLRMYAVSGIDLVPRYVWLDAKGNSFAGEWMIREGWEAQYSELRAVMDQAAYDFAANAKRQLADDDAEALAITGVRVFDPASGNVLPDQTILIEGDRIAAVSSDDVARIPSTSRRIDGSGLMALPGLWDMHAHVADPRIGHPVTEPLLYLAAGITSVRDLGGEFKAIVRLRDAIENGEVAGPRVFAAGFIDHVDGEEHDIGEAVGTLDEVRSAVDKYADAGFGQIKIYNSVPSDHVDAIVRHAKERGLGIAGHVPFDMTTREAIAAGYNELQHLQIVHSALPMSTGDAIKRGETWSTYYHLLASDYDPSSAAVRSMINDLVAHDVAVDTTIGIYIERGQPPAYYADYAQRLPHQPAFRLRHSLPCASCSQPQDPFEKAGWRKVSDGWLKIINALHHAGVPLLIGSDRMYPHEVLRHEMKVLVERADIPPTEVLHAATLGAARAAGMDRELGSIEPGKLADIILISGDPTSKIDDIRNVGLVIQGGTIYRPSQIKALFDIEQLP